MATGAAYGTIRLWNLPASVLTCPGGTINTVSFGPSGQILAASDSRLAPGAARIPQCARQPPFGLVSAIVSCGRAGSSA